MSTTDDTNAARRGSGSNDLLGLAPTRTQVNDWMTEAGWQNSAIRQADLDGVKRVVRAAVAAERERCAKLAEGAQQLPNDGKDFANGWCSAALQIAQAIRA